MTSKEAHLLVHSEETRDFDGQQMHKNVCPASNGILGSNFPGLEAITSIEKMKRFPEIED
jgi:hypothetical protein